MSWGKSYGSYFMPITNTTDLSEIFREYDQQVAGVSPFRSLVSHPVMPVLRDEDWAQAQAAVHEAAERQRRATAFDAEAIMKLGDQEMADAKQQNPVVLTPTGYLSFANLFEKRAVVQGGEERYSVNLILDEKDMATEAYKALQKAVMDAAHKFWGDKLPKNIAWPIKDAGEKADKYEGYTEGRKFISAWTKTSPGIIGPKKEDILDKDAIWAGQRARLAVKPFAYDKGGNKGVGLVLDCVQIVRFDMPRIDGKAPAKSLFPDDLGDANEVDDDEIPF